MAYGDRWIGWDWDNARGEAVFTRAMRASPPSAQNVVPYDPEITGDYERAVAQAEADIARTVAEWTGAT